MNTSDAVKPWLRRVKYSWLQRLAEYKVKIPTLREQDNRNSKFVFLIGCGRSGTTLLGHILSQHNDINYFFEPYHLWAAIDPRTDVLNLYHRIDAHFLMNASHVNEVSKTNFNRIFSTNLFNRNKTILEKTPLNAMRIGYLNSLQPQAKFIHIVRDGVDVSSSIERIATTNTYKIAGKPKLNQWWGVENYKWQALLKDGISAGYYSDEVSLLTNYYSKGAYEWLVTLGEVERWREQLANRFYEITYNQLTLNPEDTLRNVCKFLELDSSDIWLNQATNMIRLDTCALRAALSLPPTMCNAFNHYQKRFGFLKRAIPLERVHC